MPWSPPNAWQACCGPVLWSLDGDMGRIAGLRLSVELSEWGLCLTEALSLHSCEDRVLGHEVLGMLALNMWGPLVHGLLQE